MPRVGMKQPISVKLTRWRGFRPVAGGLSPHYGCPSSCAPEASWSQACAECSAVTMCRGWRQPEDQDSHNEFLCTRKTYKNFIIKLDVKLVGGSRVNEGVAELKKALPNCKIYGP